MPTSNPSDEQLELVTGRVIELAQALYPYVALDDGAYFDTAGFDEHMAAELAARVEGYCRNADGVAIYLSPGVLVRGPPGGACRPRLPIRDP